MLFLLAFGLCNIRMGATLPKQNGDKIKCVPQKSPANTIGSTVECSELLQTIVNLVNLTAFDCKPVCDSDSGAVVCHARMNLNLDQPVIEG
jgi:hypothetical protein